MRHRLDGHIETKRMVRSTEDRRYTTTKSSRRSLIVIHPLNTPPNTGPETYRIESSVGRDAPAASISGRFDLTTDSFQPGPGAYDVRKVGEVGSSAPAFTMAGRPTDHHSSAVTGKGTPGPGQYTVAVPSTAPAITMQGRHEPHEASREQWKVGPGAYEVVVSREAPTPSRTHHAPAFPENSGNTAVTRWNASSCRVNLAAQPTDDQLSTLHST